MTDKSSAPCSNSGRRVFLAKVSSLATATIAGCGKMQRGAPREEPTYDTITPTADPRDDIGEIVQDISSLYERLSELPIIKDSKFVFRVKTFENDFDQKQLFTDAELVLRELDRRRSPDRDSPRIESLIASTELAKLLARQRGIVHQVIAAGLVYHRRISQGKYHGAADAIQKAQRFVVNLRKNVDRIAETIEGPNWSLISIEEFDLDSISGSQTHLVEICRWTKFAYEGLNRTIQGIQRFETANTNLEDDDYSGAAADYEESHKYFRSAVESFDKAQRRGKKIPHLVPVVEGMRCLLPAYLESSRNLGQSMDEFEAGNHNHAKTIAREALVTADNKASRCF